jgi:monoamine oxidase
LQPFPRKETCPLQDQREFSGMIIIIGAGISGLYLARELEKQNAEYILLESTERIGGRLHTITAENGHVIDLGGMWVGPGQTDILELIEELQLEQQRQYSKGMEILHVRGKRVQYLHGGIPALSLFALLDYQLGISSRISRLVTNFPPNDPMSVPLYAELDKISVYEWACKNLWTWDACELFFSIVRILVCVEPSEVSMLGFLSGFKAAGGFEAAIATENGAQQDRLKVGGQGLCQKLADQLDSKRIVHGQHVIRIEQNEDQVTVQTVSGAVYIGTHLVLAIPPTAYRKVKFDPPLPTDRLNIINRMFMGAVAKVYLLYDKPFWREDGFSGMVLSDSFITSVSDTSYETTFSLTAFICGKYVSECYGRNKTEERKKRVLDQMNYFFKNEKIFSPKYYVEYNWVDDISEGAYSNIYGAGAGSYGELSDLQKPIGRVHFAGTETASHWNGYMSGGISSAKRVLKELS